MFEINVGDLAPAMLITCTSTSEPAGANISGATSLQLDWLKPDGTQVLVDLDAVDLVTGQVSRTWEAGDTDVAGTHQGRVRITRGDGKPQTFPSDGSSLRWVVHAPLAPC